MNKRNALPTCGAARPTPHALYIVSYILAIVSFNSGCSCEIFSPTFLKTGWPYPTIGKNYIIIIIILSIISPTDFDSFIKVGKNSKNLDNE
jgi:hypothetical protein